MRSPWHRAGALRRAAPIALVAFLAAAPAQASGAWTTYLRAINYTAAIAESTTVWCATLEAGLRRFDRTTAKFTPLTREPGGLASNHLTTLAEDRSRRLWVGTQDDGLSYLSADRTRWNLLNQFDGLPSDTITALEAQGDTIWIGTSGGLSLWNGREVAGTLPDGINPSPFPSNSLTGIVVLGDSLIVSTLEGIVVSSIRGGLTSWSPIQAGLPSLRVESLASDGRDLLAFSTDTTWKLPYRLVGSIWRSQGGIGGVRRVTDSRDQVLATTGAGIYRWTGSAWSLIPGSPISLPPRNTWMFPAIDPLGTVFAASRTALYEQVSGAPWVAYVPVEPPGNEITNLLVDGDHLWVNTFIQGVGRFDGSTWKNWAPQRCALPACDPDTTFFFSGFSFALIADRDGRKWISTWGLINDPQFPGSIERIDDVPETGADPPFAFDRIQSWPDGIQDFRHTFATGATLDSSGSVWLGMSSAERENADYSPIGIDRYDAAGNWVRTYGTRNGLLTGRILALTTDKSGRVWIGTTGKGVQYHEPFDDTIRTVPQNDPTADVRGIVAAGDTIWAQTTNDVRWYSRASLLKGREFPVLAGPTDEAAHPLDVAADGTVWAGTVNGIRVYRRDGGIVADYTMANSPLASDEVHAIRADLRTGVVWIGTAAGLHRYDPRGVPPPPELERLEARVYPNPVRLSSLGFGLRVVGNVTSFHGGVYDLSGRRLHAFRDVPSGGEVWNGFDDGGRRVRPGLYFVRLESGGRSVTMRVVVMR